MRSKGLLGCAIVIGVLVGTQWLTEAGKTNADESSGDSILSKLGDGGAFRVALRKERERYQSFVQDLIQIVKSDIDDQTKECVVDVLGELRAKQAVPVLVEGITSLVSVTREGPQMVPHIGMFPCARALVSIGKPAVGPLLEVVAASGDKQVREVATHTIEQIEMSKTARTAIYDALEKEANSRRKLNLQSALEHLEK